MSLGSRLWAVVALTALLLFSAYADERVFPQAEGSKIEMPGPSRPISIREYRVQTSARPYVHLKRSIGASEINYFVDEVGRGVVSGNMRRQLNFYAACRREPGELVCIELYYRPEMQSEYSEMIGRIARSFSKGDRW